MKCNYYKYTFNYHGSRYTMTINYRTKPARHHFYENGKRISAGKYKAVFIEFNQLLTGSGNNDILK